MPHDEHTIIVDPTKESKAYPVWEFDPPDMVRVTHKHGKWCWSPKTDGLPTDLQNKFDTWCIKDVCQLIEDQPAYFFYGVDQDSVIWERPCQPGEDAPRVNGIDVRGHIHIAIVAWHDKEAIETRVHEIATHYAPQYAAGKVNMDKKTHARTLTCHIVIPGRANCHSLANLMDSHNALRQQLTHQWQEVRLRFGLLQLGWRAATPQDHLLRIYWIDETSWEFANDGFQHFGTEPEWSFENHLTPASMVERTRQILAC